MIIPLQAKCQSPEEAPQGHWAEIGIGDHSSHSSLGPTGLESSSGHCWDYYPHFMNGQTKVSAAAVVFVVIPCLKDRDRLGIWMFLCPVPCCGCRQARVNSLSPRYPSPAANHPA